MIKNTVISIVGVIKGEKYKRENLKEQGPELCQICGKA